MSRPLRIQYSGAWYHVMNRGLNRRLIFHTDFHRHLFFNLLSDIHERYGVQTHAYCLMDNHYHLLLHTPHPNLSRAMRHLDGIYTQRFNCNQKRDGPLFRGRYKAILVEEGNYLLQLSRYIHLNPTSANLCSKPEAYAWSSYQAYLNIIKRPDWLYCNEILLQCSEIQPIDEYKKFVEEEIDENILKILSEKQLPSLLGGKEWIEKIKQQHIAEKLVHDEIPSGKDLMREDDLDIHTLIQHVANHYNVQLEEIKHRGNRYSKNEARNILIYLASACYGYENKEIAYAIGDISGSGVSQIRGRMQKKLENNAVLKLELNELKQLGLPMSNVKTWPL